MKQVKIGDIDHLNMMVSEERALIARGLGILRQTSTRDDLEDTVSPEVLIEIARKGPLTEDEIGGTELLTWAAVCRRHTGLHNYDWEM